VHNPTDREGEGVQVCVACGAHSPRTQTSYTLIGSRYKWRLSLRDLADGRRVGEWRCPSCWEIHKGRKRRMP
jgi:hypothetical protein